jgi:hypothetical protein
LVEHTLLWRNLRGKTPFRVFGALILDEICGGTNLSTAEQLRMLRKVLHRSMSRQSLAAWRSGDRAAPNDVMLAAATIARRKLADASITVVMKVLGDPEADPSFAKGLRYYYSQGRVEIPAREQGGLASNGAAARPKGPPRELTVPLWRNLWGKTTYRVFGALILDELCEQTDMSNEELQRRVRKELRRPLSRQTWTGWRRGDRSVPNDVMLATAMIVGTTLAEASLKVAVKVSDDPHADASFASALRSYFSEDRLDLASEGASRLVAD